MEERATEQVGNGANAPSQMGKVPMSERLFVHRMAASNAIGYAISVWIATYVDARLRTHALYHARFYPGGYWMCLIGVAVYASTLVGSRSMDEWWARAILPTLALLILGVASLGNFTPEIPHLGFSLGIVLFALSGLLASWIHYVPVDAKWISDQEVPIELRLERIRMAITLWRTTALALAFGYLAIVVPWGALLWSTGQGFLSSKAEVFINASAWSVFIWVYSTAVLVGPIYEAYKKTSLVSDLILSAHKQASLVSNSILSAANPDSRDTLVKP